MGALLVTGGLGALGSLAASWATQRGTRQLLLTGRSGREGAGSPLGGLATWQGLAVLARCDLSAYEDALQLARFCPSTFMHAGKQRAQLLMSCVQAKHALRLELR